MIEFGLEYLKRLESYLILINLKRISEPLIGYIIEEFNLDGILLSGLDTVDNDMSSDYLISITELESCFEELKSR